MTDHRAPAHLEPTFTEHELLDRDEAPFRIRGRLLGFVTTQRDDHTDHGGDFADRGDRCPACRWFEVRIFEVDSEIGEITKHNEPILELPRGRYLLLTYGRSEVPGEITRRRASWTNSPYELLEQLTQRRPGSRPFLPGASAKALAQAAEFDDGINDAYVNRAVA